MSHDSPYDRGADRPIDTRPKPPAIAHDPTQRRIATAAEELAARDVKLGDKVTVTVATEPRFDLAGRIVAATPYVLVITDETTRHRLPWSRVALISTTTAPEHPGL